MTASLKLRLNKSHVETTIGAVATLQLISTRNGSPVGYGKRIETVVPAGWRDEIAKSVNVEPGLWRIEATLPSGEVLHEDVTVADGQTLPVVLQAAEHSPREWLSLQHLVGNIEGDATLEKARAERQILERAQAPRRGLGAPAGVAAAATPRPVTAPNVHLSKKIDPFATAEAWNTILDPGTRGLERCPPVDSSSGPSQPLIWLYQIAGESERRCAFVNWRGEGYVASLPLPWISLAQQLPVAAQLMVRLDPKSQETRLGVVVEDPDFSTISGLMTASTLPSAVIAVRQAESMLLGKVRHPLGATAGAYVLVAAADPKDDEWPSWVDNLANWFPAIPDGAVLRAALRLRYPKDKNAHEEAKQSLLEAFDRGIPYYSAGVSWLLDGLSRFARDPEVKKRLTLAHRIALRLDMSQAFTVIRVKDRLAAERHLRAAEQEVDAMPPRAKAPASAAAPAAKRSSPSRKAAADTAEKLKRVAAATRINLYSAREYLDSSTLDELTVNIPFDVYFQDPAVREATKAYNFDENFTVPWEPGISDGPTSARFVVIDYDGTTEALNPAAKWDKKNNVFRDKDGKVLDRNNLDSSQFHQVNVWATLQNALDFYESGAGLGRRISWGFEGNRLIVVPHAGYGENAYYDRDSKSLQFYYFDYKGERVNTCLSADIINHEFGHAVLDGIRPLYRESVQVETAAFHEFMGDISAILIAFRNTKLRRQIAKVTGGDLDKDTALSNLAEQFGRKDDKPYLRTALNKIKYREVKDSQSHHHMSQVMTGAMFDILREVYRYNVKTRGHTILQSLWFAASRMQNLTVQPLDLLPAVDVTFADYAEAVLRAEQIVNPTDPQGYRKMMLDVFSSRGILSAARIKELKEEPAVLDPVEMAVFHEAGDIAASRANAYRFLDDNRRQLLIPYGADLVVSDLSTAVKFTTRRRRQAKHVLLQYVWREDVPLVGSRFGQFDGQTTDLLCGATLALDIDGNLLAWARKPGTLPLIRSVKVEDKKVDAEAAAGKRRREAFLDALAARIQAGRVGGAPASGAVGLLQKSIAPLNSYVVDGTVRFGLAPHVGIRNEAEDEDDEIGDRSWSISS